MFYIRARGTILATTLGFISNFLNPASANATTQTTFPDIQGHWAQRCIEQLAARDIVSGYPNGTFRPSEPVTRAEFAALLTNTLTSNLGFQISNSAFSEYQSQILCLLLA